MRSKTCTARATREPRPRARSYELHAIDHTQALRYAGIVAHELRADTILTGHRLRHNRQRRKGRVGFQDRERVTTSWTAS
jgi:hypothetical protein